MYGVFCAITESPAFPQPPVPSCAVAAEELYRQTAVEALARHPGRVLRSMGIALANQLALWPPSDLPGAAENMYWSARLRGEFQEGPTNFSKVQFDDVQRACVAALAQRCERDITYMRGSTGALWFNELYWTYRQARPVLSVLFLAGLVLALRARAYAWAGLGLLALCNAVAFAVLVGSPIDRYSAPFLPLSTVVALYGAHRMLAAGATRRLPAPRAVGVPEASSRAPSC